MLQGIYKSLNELERRLSNLINIGVVSEVDYDKCTARVKIGEIETAHLDFATIKAGKAKIWNPPEIGEQVLVLSPCGDLNNGIIWGALYAKSSKAPSNIKSKEHRIIPAGVEVKTNLFKIDGKLQVTGAAKFDSTVSVSGDVNTKKKSVSEGEQIAKGILTSEHIHSCAGSPGKTFTPQ